MNILYMITILPTITTASLCTYAKWIPDGLTNASYSFNWYGNPVLSPSAVACPTVCNISCNAYLYMNGTCKLGQFKELVANSTRTTAVPNNLWVLKKPPKNAIVIAGGQSSNIITVLTSTGKVCSNSAIPNLPYSQVSYAQLVSDETAGNLYLVGGQIGASTNILTNMSHINLHSDTPIWELKSPMPSGRTCHCAIYRKGQIYVFGGSPSVPSTRVDRYNTVQNAWTSLSSAATTKDYSTVPSATTECSAVIEDKYVFMAFSKGNATFNVFDLVSETTVPTMEQQIPVIPAAFTALKLASFYLSSQNKTIVLISDRVNSNMAVLDWSNPGAGWTSVPNLPVLGATFLSVNRQTLVMMAKDSSSSAYLIFTFDEEQVGFDPNSRQVLSFSKVSYAAVGVANAVYFNC